MAKVVNAGGYVLHVRSVAGVESCCYVESVDVAFDLGCIVDKVVSKSHVFISHGHTDHIAALVMHAAQRALNGMKPASYYVPAHLVPHVEATLQSAAAMQEDERFAARIVPLQPFDQVQLTPLWVVRAVPTTHRVASLGYVLYKHQRKLKADLAVLSGREIAALKRAGQEVTTSQLIPEIAYTGDTTIDALAPTAGSHDEEANDLLRVKVLITEATYADDKMTAAEASARGHIHVDQLAAHAQWFQHVEALVLVHFSARYREAELRECVQRRLPPALLDKTLLGC